MNKKYPDDYVRCIGLEYLNERISLAALSRIHGIPYETVKFFKRRGFYFNNFKEYSFSKHFHYIADGKRILALRRRSIKLQDGSIVGLWIISDKELIKGNSFNL
tara:strand:- start:1393 stop:1704 length:312 start_codon:yes stop_codon:yes gene_type:complete